MRTGHHRNYDAPMLARLSRTDPIRAWSGLDLQVSEEERGLFFASTYMGVGRRSITNAYILSNSLSLSKTDAFQITWGDHLGCAMWFAVSACGPSSCVASRCFGQSGRSFACLSRDLSWTAPRVPHRSIRVERPTIDGRNQGHVAG